MTARIVYAFGELHSSSLYVIYREDLHLNNDETRKKLDNRLRVTSKIFRDVVRKKRITRIFAEWGEVVEKGKRLRMLFPVERFIKEYSLDFFEGDIINLDENRDLHYTTKLRKLEKNATKVRIMLEQQLFAKYRTNQLERTDAEELDELIKNNNKDGILFFVANWVEQQSELKE